MSEHAIPDDLKEEYESAKWRVADHASPGGLHKMKLIERIAKAEATVKRLAAPFTVEEWNGKYTNMPMRSRETVNVLLAERKEK